jgi:hypothetical protein
MVRVLSNYAGLIWAPLVWAINTQLSQMLPYADCRGHTHLMALTACAAVVLTLGASSLSYARLRTASSRESVFIGWLSVLCGLIFTLALIFQEAATLLLSPCER